VLFQSWSLSIKSISGPPRIKAGDQKLRLAWSLNSPNGWVNSGHMATGSDKKCKRISCSWRTSMVRGRHQWQQRTLNISVQLPVIEGPSKTRNVVLLHNCQFLPRSQGIMFDQRSSVNFSLAQVTVISLINSCYSLLATADSLKCQLPDDQVSIWQT